MLQPGVQAPRPIDHAVTNKPKRKRSIDMKNGTKQSTVLLAAPKDVISYCTDLTRPAHQQITQID